MIRTVQNLKILLMIVIKNQKFKTYLEIEHIISFLCVAIPQYREKDHLSGFIFVVANFTPKVFSLKAWHALSKSSVIVYLYI
jgi:hypothetical protein